MILSPTALRMLRTTPAYFHGNPFAERILQGMADEVDRLDALIDACMIGVVPGEADDEYGFLSWWEMTLGLPVAPHDVATAVRQSNVRARWRGLDATAAADVLALLADVAGGVVEVVRNTPGNLRDTVTIPAAAGSYEGGRAAETARRVWPAHRLPVIVFDP